MIQEQAAAAVIIVLISEKNESGQKGKKEEYVWNLGLKEKRKLRILWNSACRTEFRRRT